VGRQHGLSDLLYSMTAKHQKQSTQVPMIGPWNGIPARILLLRLKINAALVHGYLQNLQLMYVHFRLHCGNPFIPIMQSGPVVGQIIEILARAGSAIVSLNIYQVASTQHNIFGMPTLGRRHDKISILILPAIVSSVYLLVMSFELMCLLHKVLPI